MPLGYPLHPATRPVTEGSDGTSHTNFQFFPNIPGTAGSGQDLFLNGVIPAAEGHDVHLQLGSYQEHYNITGGASSTSVVDGDALLQNTLIKERMRQSYSEYTNRYMQQYKLTPFTYNINPENHEEIVNGSPLQ